MKIEYELNTYRDKAKGFIVLPLYGSLNIEDQSRVFEKFPNRRKIIVSTNIAETSVTIDGVVYVIDCGLSKKKIYNPRTKSESLLISPISKANALQRAGRAGRTQRGKCYRLYTKISFEKDLEDHSIPEILRVELSSTIINLKTIGIKNIVNFDFIDPPSVETVLRSLEILVNIGAID